MTAKANILIVDDESVVRDSLGKWFTEEGYNVETASSAKDALLKLPIERWDLALLDIKMPGMDGLELNRKMREAHPEIIIIIMTGYASVETAVQALKDGAYDYITKPFDPDDLTHVIQKALEHFRMKQENLRMRETLDELQAVELLGQSAPIQKVVEMIRIVAPTDTTVLITGESGTGKELVARSIHNLSVRRYMPMVVIHCGALTETLLESELFGHEKGAFTGAQYRKKGKFEVAEGGTVFLDEISDISLRTQTDLLRVLQEKEITRVGGTQAIKVDFRAIAATNKDLEGKVKEGVFRSDLYYRLDVFEIRVPPLRDRRDDIPLLAHHFIRKYARAMNRRFTGITQAALSLLSHHDWPGNVRELENAIERAVVIGHEPELQESDFPLQVASTTDPASGQALQDVERAHILKVLEGCNWNQSMAARVLKIDRVTLYNKIKRYGFKKATVASA
ncbi:MAG: sigma-54-dependent Fis family transcriptional regulator [Acidobacteria bacterium]|nr:sigma-54-dependent Fis family transcriptional regulator [Acidobacteriota bacterium]